VPVEHREPDGGLVAEGDGQRLLQVGAAGHGRIAIALGEAHEDAANLSEVGVDRRQGVADLQHDGRVHDVLRCRTPMDVAPRFAAHPAELMHERQDRIADELGLLSQQVEVERLGLRTHRDLLRCVGRDHAAAPLGARERHLDLHVARNQGALVEDLPHARGPERVTKEG
jgi:hypothetical protein